MKRSLKLMLGMVLFAIPNIVVAQENSSESGYGSGFAIKISSKDQEHIPAAGDDPDGQGPVKLHLSYPLISRPKSNAAQAYNRAIASLALRWWKDIGAPPDNSQAADPATDYSLDCEPVGPSIEGGPPPEAMLHGVISMFCSVYIFHLGAAHGGGQYSGFNWIVSQKRPIRPADIFISNSGWLNALSALVQSDRQGASPEARKLDVADTRHWVLGSEGLGFSYSAAEFVGYEEGGDGGVDAVIPWSKLKPYLRKDGLAPRGDLADIARSSSQYAVDGTPHLN